MFSLTPFAKPRNGNRALTPADHPFALIRQEFDSLFNRVFGHWPGLAGWDDTPSWDLGVQDNGTEYLVRAEAPGFEASDFDVQLAGDRLHIRAESKQQGKEGEPLNDRYFERTVTLPGGADFDKVEAKYRNGVLEVRLPKTPDALGRRIEVKT
jgi:HSP20 family protein